MRPATAARYAERVHGNDSEERRVEIRGYEIDLAASEKALCALPEVSDAAVVGSGQGGRERLVAFVVPRGSAPWDADRLRRALDWQLPEWAAPDHLEPLALLPRLEGGAVDRARLEQLSEPLGRARHPHSRRPWRPFTSLVPIQPLGHRPPLFAVHGIGGRVEEFRRLAYRLGLDRPTYGLRAIGLEHEPERHSSVEEMAAHYAEEIMRLAPTVPIYLCGHSLGGLIALETARTLERAGARLSGLVVLDSVPRNLPWSVHLRTCAPYLRGRPRYHARELLRGEVRNRSAYAIARIRALYRILVASRAWGDPGGAAAEAPPPGEDPLERTHRYYRTRCLEYQPRPIRAPVLLVSASGQPMNLKAAWRYLSSGRLQVEEHGVRHNQMLRAEHAPRLAALLERHLALG